MATLDQFDTKALQDAVIINRAPTQFLLNKFFRAAVEHLTEAIKIDIYKQNRKAAAYVQRRAEGENVTLTGYETNSYIPPYTKPKTQLSPSDLRKRAPGVQEVLADGSGEEQIMQASAAFWVSRELQKLDDRISRAEERQAAELSLTGSVTARDADGNTLETVSYGRDASLNAASNTPSTLWADSSAQPITDLRDWKRKLRRISGVQDRRVCVVMGWKAANRFIENDGVKEYLDNRRYPPGYELQMQEEAMDLATFIGNIEGMEIYSYDGVYDSSTEDDDYFIDQEKLIMGFVDDSGDLYRRDYGAIEYFMNTAENTPIAGDVGSPLIPAQRFPVSWIENDPATLVLQMHAAPLLVTRNPDAFLTAAPVAA